MDSDCTGGRTAMQFDTASQNKIQRTDKGNEEVSFIYGRRVVQPGVAWVDDMRTQGLCGVDLQGEALRICHRVYAACQ